MDNEAAYWNAFYPPAVSVCGIALKPFSVGHSWHLRSIGSPFIHGFGAGIDDFLLALWVCSNCVSQEFSIHSQTLPFGFRMATKAIEWMPSPIRKRLEARLRVEARKLSEHINDADDFRPPVESKDHGICRKSTCPPQIPMQRALMNHYGFSETEFLNMPLKKAKWLYYAWLEHERAIDFTTSDDVKAKDYLKSEAWKKRQADFIAKRGFLPGRGRRAR